MTRLLARTRLLVQGPLRARLGLGRAHGRRDETARGRLRAAREDFDLSVLALRKAALDHVDCQEHASVALRANLDRLARRLACDGRPA